MPRTIVVLLLLGGGLRAAAAAEPGCASAACINLVLDGDSISAGVGASPGHTADRQMAAALGEAVRLQNVAAGGRPVSECLQLYPVLVAPLFVPAAGSNVIVFHAGDNDIARGRNAAQTYAAFTAYVAAAHQQGWKIVVSTELRRPDFPPPQEAELESYNDRLRRNDAGADAVVDLDAEPRMADLSYRADPEVFTPDRIHPSDGGYAVLAGLLAPAVRRVAGR